MILFASVWLCLTTSMVYGTTITISSNGSNEADCCYSKRGGRCPCNSLSSALKHMQDDTTINIISDITLHNDDIEIYSLKNITISGNDVTIACNNIGSIYLESCSNVNVMGITWYQCGTYYPKDGSFLGALDFKTVSNVIIQYCVFQNSPTCPIHIEDASGSITISGSNFIANAVDYYYNTDCAGLYVYSETTNLYISVYDSKFDGNGCRLLYRDSCYLFSAKVCAPANTVFKNTVFSNNSYALLLDFPPNTVILSSKTVHVELSRVTIFNSTLGGVVIGSDKKRFTFNMINISSSTFVNSINPLTMVLPPKDFSVSLTKFAINLQNSVFSNNKAISNNVITTSGILSMYYHTLYSFTLLNCYFYNNFNGAIDIQLVSPVMYTSSLCPGPHITFTNITIYNTTTNDDNGSNVYVSIQGIETSINVQFTDVNFTLNHHLAHNGKILLISNSNLKCTYSTAFIQFLNCTFNNNTAFDNVVDFQVTINEYDPDNNAMVALFALFACDFNNNFGGSSILNIKGPTSGGLDSSVHLNDVMFNNNKGTALHCSFSDLMFEENVVFTNNRAISGAAIYFEEIHSVWSNNADIKFINNSAIQKGGALYFNLDADYCNVFPEPFNASFIDNSAGTAGNSIYFSIPQGCQTTNSTSSDPSLFHIPNKFNYSQQSYTIGSPTVTSPHSIKLYPPEVVPVHNSSDNYFMQQSKMLGETIQFTASVIDYFSKVTESVTFFISCKGCGHNYALSTYKISVHNKSSSELIVSSITQRDVSDNVNISLTLLSLIPPIYKDVNTILTIEMSSCRTGYLFHKVQQCICYPHHDIVHCNDDYTEIRIGYWIGYISGQYASSICPSDYCNFAERTETSLGYYDLSRKSDDQCNSHRTGVACGKCKQGYTLAYDSPDCISENKCSVGMTFLVLFLTILYWFAVVAVVFGLLYLPLQSSSTLGYAFGIIYFYSIVDILLVSDVSKEVYQVVAILSSFAKLTPRMFGQLCFVEGLSGIDQQFIHYCHALAVSGIVLVIVLIARISPRLLMYVNRCIIRVICVLILLAYTSLASTSLQLLRPLTFNDIDEVRTYSSPDIKYFSGRHIAYGIVAVLCEITVGIGLPLLLLLEPLLSRKVNFVRIKPLIDPFQRCYKNKYRWFAAYYLICRQVLILIVIVGNRDYYNMLYYLQTACVIIAMIHAYIQPYESNRLNGLDAVILLILVLVVNVNTFPSFSQSISSGLSMTLIILPLLLFCFTVIRNILGRCYKGNNPVLKQLLNPADEDENKDDNERRYEIIYIQWCVILSHCC